MNIENLNQYKRTFIVRFFVTKITKTGKSLEITNVKMKNIIVKKTPHLKEKRQIILLLKQLVKELENTDKIKKL